MPHITVDDLRNVFDDVSEAKPGRTKYKDLLVKVSPYYLNEQPESEIRTAIKEYFTPRGDSTNSEIIVNRLYEWAIILQASTEGGLPEDLRAVRDYMYKIISEELLLISNQIIAQTTPDAIRYLSHIMFLQEDVADLSVLTSKVETDPRLLVSPILTYIFSHRINEYSENHFMNETINEFVDAVIAGFQTNPPDFTDNPSALEAWIIFWICQPRSADTGNILSQLVTQYYANSYEFMLENLIAFAEINSIEYFPVLGKLLLAGLTEQQSSAIRKYLIEFFKEPNDAEHVIVYCTSKYKESETLDHYDLMLLSLLPQEVLANESLLQNILSVMTNHKTEPYILNDAWLNLQQIISAISEHGKFNAIEVLDSIQLMPGLFSANLRKFFNVRYQTLCGLTEVYFKDNQRKEILIDYILKLYEKGNLTENLIKLLAATPAHGDLRIIHLLCKIIEAPTSTSILKALCRDCLRNELLASNHDQILAFMKSIHNTPYLICAFVGTFVCAKAPAFKQGESFLQQISQPLIINEIVKLERSNAAALHLVANKYVGLNMSDILKIGQTIIYAKSMQYVQAQTPDDKARINQQFVDSLCETLTPKFGADVVNNIRKMNLDNFLEDLMRFQELGFTANKLAEINKFIGSLPGKLAPPELKFAEKFIAIVTKEAADIGAEDEEEENESSLSELHYAELKANEKAEMLKLLQQQLEKLVKRPGSAEANNKYAEYIMENLHSRADLGKYLRPQMKKKRNTSTDESRIDAFKTIAKLDKMLADDFPLKQETPHLHAGGHHRKGRHT